MSFHYIARAVILQDKHILLVKEIGSDLTFLPGGHIEFAEPAKKGLRRELLEETGITAEIGEFLGAVENSWMEREELQAEINLLFKASIPPTISVTAQEPHLEFLWVELGEVEKYNLMPTPLVTFLQKESPHISGNVFWASTLG